MFGKFRKIMIAPLIVAAVTLLISTAGVYADSEPVRIRDETISVELQELVGLKDGEKKVVEGSVIFSENGNENTQKLSLTIDDDTEPLTYNLKNTAEDHDIVMTYDLLVSDPVEEGSDQETVEGITKDEDSDQTEDESENKSVDVSEDQTEDSGTTDEDQKSDDEKADDTNSDEGNTEDTEKGDSENPVDPGNPDGDKPAEEIKPENIKDEITYRYIAERKADVTYSEGKDVIGGSQITVTFPKSAVKGGEVSFYKSNGEVVETKKTDDLSDNKLTFTVPKGLGDNEKLSVSGKASFEEEGFEWEYIFPDNEYIFHTAPATPVVTVTNSNRNSAAVKQGDSITIAISDIRSCDRATVTVNGETVSPDTAGAYVYHVGSLADLTGIQWKVVISDIYGNETAEASGGGITYYGPLTGNANVDKNCVRIGESVTLSWTINHQAAASGIFLDQEFSTDGNSVSKTVMEVPDQTMCGYTLSMTDPAGNTLTLSDTLILVYAPLEVLSVSFTPNVGYVKDGDSVSLVFTLNHNASFNGTIAQNEVSGTAEPTGNLVVTINSLDDESLVSAFLSLTDDLGQSAIISETGAMYLAPILASASINHNPSKTEGYVKNGDSINAYISANHDVTVNNATFGGQSAIANGSTVSCVVQNISDGVIVFHSEVTDAAGNTAVIEENTGVICDNTAPKITVTPDVNLFSSEDVRLVLQAEDDNLASAVFTINGKETSAPTSSNSATQIITITDEDQYTYSARAEDKAGNTAESSTGSVIVDKTDPKVISYGINSGDDTVYAAGIRLTDFFKVSDDYLQSVNAYVSLQGGTSRSVGLDEELTDEGKQTAQITAKDMAGNQTRSVSYTYYIDATKPKVLLTRTGTRTLVYNTSKNEMTEGDKLTVTLDEIWMGSEKPDKLTSVQVKTKDGKTEELLKKQNTSELDLTLPSDAAELIIKAEDDVGNLLEGETYQFNTQAKGSSTFSVKGTIPEKAAEETGKTGLKIAAISIGVAAVIAVLAWIVIKKRTEAQKS